MRAALPPQLRAEDLSEVAPRRRGPRPAGVARHIIGYNSSQGTRVTTVSDDVVGMGNI
jgi:hypothetical protein